MSEFTNVTITRAANIYFDGKVTSRSVVFPNGEHKTLGIMLPGDYEFGTEAPELMEIQSGELSYALGDDNWQSVRGGESFKVPGNFKFQLRVSKVTDYCCSFLPAA